MKFIGKCHKNCFECSIFKVKQSTSEQSRTLQKYIQRQSSLIPFESQMAINLLKISKLSPILYQ